MRIPGLPTVRRYIQGCATWGQEPSFALIMSRESWIPEQGCTGLKLRPWGSSSTSHFTFTATPMPEVLHCTGICTAVRWQMQRAAQTDAAHCGGRCSAPRRPMQRTAFFATIRPPFRPTPFHQSKDCSPPILRNAQQALHQTDSNSPDTAFWHTQEKATPPHRAQRPPRTSPFQNFCLPIPYYSEAKSTKAPRAVGFSGKLFNFAREKGKDQPPSA